MNHKTIETARKGQEVCIKIEPLGGEAPKMYGRHFDHTDLLVSKVMYFKMIALCTYKFLHILLNLLYHFNFFIWKFYFHARVVKNNKYFLIALWYINKI